MRNYGKEMRVAVAAFLLLGWVAGPGPVVAYEKPEHEKTHSPAEVFQAMAGVFQVEKAKGVHIRYLFQLSEPQGGNWYIIVNDGKMSMGKGTIENPDCTVICTGADWVELDNGTLGGTRAYLTGRLKVKGDRSLAHKLNQLFP
jgi:putative sterol carrier protein